MFFFRGQQGIIVIFKNENMISTKKCPKEHMPVLFGNQSVYFR